MAVLGVLERRKTAKTNCGRRHFPRRCLLAGWKADGTITGRSRCFTTSGEEEEEGGGASGEEGKMKGR